MPAGSEPVILVAVLPVEEVIAEVEGQIECGPLRRGFRKLHQQLVVLVGIGQLAAVARLDGPHVERARLRPPVVHCAFPMIVETERQEPSGASIEKEGLVDLDFGVPVVVRAQGEFEAAHLHGRLGPLLANELAAHDIVVPCAQSAEDVASEEELLLLQDGRIVEVEGLDDLAVDLAEDHAGTTVQHGQRGGVIDPEVRVVRLLEQPRQLRGDRLGTGLAGAFSRAEDLVQEGPAGDKEAPSEVLGEDPVPIGVRAHVREDVLLDALAVGSILGGVDVTAGAVEQESCHLSQRRQEHGSKKHGE